MLSTLERVMFLKSADIFGAVDSEDLAPVATRAEEVTFSPGESLIREGEAADCLYIVVDGEVGVEVEGTGQVTTLGPGSAVGEMALLSGLPRSASCVAITDTLALRVDREDFLELLAERPMLALGIISLLSRRLTDTSRRVAGGG